MCTCIAQWVTADVYCWPTPIWLTAENDGTTMNFSIYQLKPGFQRLLQPVLATLARLHVTPNQITVAAMLLSLAYGAALAHFPGEPGWWLGVPVFMFQEGSDPVAESGYREIASLSRGAYCRFDTGSARELGDLLRAVAAYAAGGIRALSDLSARKAGAARMLLAQLK